MADMIEAKDAKKLLGCDDAALNGYVNGGQIRAQRAGGKLMLNKQDVEKLRKEKEDDGTIVLTGDSDDLSIDLGKVVDDSAETIVKKATDTAAGTESITFGEDLEVVSFDDNSNTSEITFDDKAKQGAGNLSFTDSNTAVMTAVDETAVGATTQPVEFQTGANEPARPASSGSSRVRSARSQRAAVEEVKVHWFFTTCLVLTLLVGMFFIVPYYVIALFPHSDDHYKRSGDRRLGLDDNAWTAMAGGIAGFSVEPSEEIFKANHKGEEFTDIAKEHDPQAKWRYLQYRGDHKDKDKYKTGDRLSDFTFNAAENPIDENTTQVKSSSGMKTYPLRTRSVEGAAGQRQITEKVPDVFPGAAGK